MVMTRYVFPTRTYLIFDVKVCTGIWWLRARKEGYLPVCAHIVLRIPDITGILYSGESKIEVVISIAPVITALISIRLAA
jgi:hypothetical protein